MGKLKKTGAFFVIYILSAIQGSADWNQIAKDRLKSTLKLKQNNRIAKNIILFIGDGLGISTVTASRIYKGQKMGTAFEENSLLFEDFPHFALSKTYSADRQVPDSAATATALMSGVKTNTGVLGLTDKVAKGNCSATKGQKVLSIVNHFLADGRSTGIVTTARVTHATPAAAYSHSATRDWEGDVNMFGVTGNCTDIAYQLVYENNDIQVVLGGGRQFFMPYTSMDPETLAPGTRRDDHDLTEIWKQIQESKERRHTYVWRKDQFDAVNAEQTDYLLGLFEYGHMQYETDRVRTGNGEPSLSEMTTKAINILKRNQNGYFLMVEGARIDHAHHENLGKRALEETLAFEEAVRVAVQLTQEEDTLIIVTADHSHPLNIVGYPYLNNDILGVTDPMTDDPPLDDLPYTTLVYANGPSHNPGRTNYTGLDTTHDNFKQESAVPLLYETHSGDDVAIYSRGPMSHLLHGVQDQHYVGHVLQYASCVGDYKYDCERPIDEISGGQPLTRTVYLIMFMCLITFYYVAVFI